MEDGTETDQNLEDSPKDHDQTNLHGPSYQKHRLLVASRVPTKYSANLESPTIGYVSSIAADYANLTNQDGLPTRNPNVRNWLPHSRRLSWVMRRTEEATGSVWT